jgi:hypothetical protein
MKLIKKLLIVVLLSALSICAKENDTKENKVVLESLYEKVIIANVTRAIEDTDSLIISLKEKDGKISKALFSKLVSSWKNV